MYLDSRTMIRQRIEGGLEQFQDSDGRLSVALQAAVERTATEVSTLYRALELIADGRNAASHRRRRR